MFILHEVLEVSYLHVHEGRQRRLPTLRLEECTQLASLQVNNLVSYYLIKQLGFILLGTQLGSNTCLHWHGFILHNVSRKVSSYIMFPGRFYITSCSRA